MSDQEYLAYDDVIESAPNGDSLNLDQSVAIRSHWYEHLDDIITALMPAVFLTASCLGIAAVIISGFITSTAAAAGVSTRRGKQ